MENKYCFEGDERVIDMFAKSISNTLKRNKYEEKIHVLHPRSPHVFHYSMKHKVVSLSTYEEEGKFCLSLESEKEIPGFQQIVEDAMVDLFKNVIVKLIRSITPTSERQNIIKDIKQILDKLG
jgi:hypothetical protein